MLQEKGQCTVDMMINFVWWIKCARDSPALQLIAPSLGPHFSSSWKLPASPCVEPAHAALHGTHQQPLLLL